MMTRCAACGTAFRITTDQLLARQGTVRCGSCQAIFNALDHLVPDPASQVVEDAADAAGIAADLFNAAPPTATTMVGESGFAAAVQDAPADDLALVYSPEPADGMSAEAASPLPAEATVDAEDAGAAALVPEAIADTPIQASAGRPPQSTGAASSLFEPSKPVRGFPWWSTAGVLVTLVALAAQGSWFYRNQLAAYQPQAKPLLEAACAELRCRIEAPVDPQAISIESSDLQADPANRAVLILSAVVRNRAPFAQKLPLLELSLTDAQDAPIARRVLKAPEYAPAPTPESIGAGSELQLRVFIDAGAVKANGYRLYAFYP